MITPDLCPATRFRRQSCALLNGHPEPHDWREPPTWSELVTLSGVRRRPDEGFTDYQTRVLAALAAR
jgi:hypothetical protein